MTPEQVKQQLEERGQSISDWARDHGFKPHAVIAVLNGFRKAKRGTGHEIAVALGLKRRPKQASQS